MARVLLIGATGHVGGEVLNNITSTYPDLVITALIRDNEKSQRLVQRYPSVTTLIGSLNDEDIVEAAAKEAEIVINTAPDMMYEKGLAAVLRGLESRSTKGYYLHTSGAALIWSEPTGELHEKVWDDIADIEQIVSMPDTKVHQITDKMVRAASSAINVAIVAPAGVSGLSVSHEHPTPLTIPSAINVVRYLNSGFIISSGSNMQGYIDVKDCADIYIALLNDALKGPQSNGDLWGPKAYYFGVSEEVSFLEYIKGLVSALESKKVVSSTEIKQIDLQETAKGVNSGVVTDWAAQIAEMFATNMRCTSSRAREYLGWQPKRKGVVEFFPEVVDVFLPRGKH